MNVRTLEILAVLCLLIAGLFAGTVSASADESAPGSNSEPPVGWGEKKEIELTFNGHVISVKGPNPSINLTSNETATTIIALPDTTHPDKDRQTYIFPKEAKGA